MRVGNVFAAAGAAAAIVMKVGVLAALLSLSPTAHAAIYKCKLGAAVTYQEQPCEKHAVAERLDEGNTGSMLGCFAMEGLEKEQPFNIRIEASAPGKLAIQLGDHPSRTPLVEATAADVRWVSDGLHIHAVRGLKLVVHGTNEQRPIGIYTIKDKDGDESIFGVFLVANGIMKRVSCR